MQFIYIWLLLGLAGTLYWPIKYIKVMRLEEWKTDLYWSPVGLIAGPFSFILMMPV